jgi:hypothetical protein
LTATTDAPTLSSLVVCVEIDARASQFHDYRGFVERIGAYPQSAQLLHGAWIIRTFDSASRVVGELGVFVREEGSLFVATITRKAAWTRVDCGSSWLYENLWG